MATMTFNWEDAESNTALVRSSFTSPKTVFTWVLARTRQPSPRFAFPKIATMFSLPGPAPAGSTSALDRSSRGLSTRYEAGLGSVGTRSVVISRRSPKVFASQVLLRRSSCSSRVRRPSE